MNLTEVGLAHLARGELDQAVAAFWAATRQDGERQPWLELAVALALAGRWQELDSLVTATGEPVRFFHTVCLHLMRLGEYEILGRARAGMPAAGEAYPVAVYFAGVRAVAAKDHAGALRHFAAFKALVLAEPARFEPLLADPNFSVMHRQGVLVEPPDYVAALDEGGRAADGPEPAIVWRREAAVEGTPPLFACCLNDLYFLRFAVGLVGSLARACGRVALHFHVVGSQADIAEAFAALEARHPDIPLGLSLEPEPLLSTNVYYSCNRFLVMPRLAAAYRRDIVMLDADALVRADLVGLCGRLAPDCDFACFDTGRTEPASVYQATLMYFAYSPGCRAFVRLLRRFISAKLYDRRSARWSLDQAALFSVSTYLEAHPGRAFVFQRLDRLTGLTLDDVVTSDGSPAEKRGLMSEGSLD